MLLIEMAEQVEGVVWCVLLSAFCVCTDWNHVRLPWISSRILF